MSKHAVENPWAMSLTLPKNNHSVVEKKHKTMYVLTRKETESFNTYMVYFLASMVKNMPNPEEYYEALTYFHDIHDMQLLTLDVNDESAFIAWNKKCLQAEEYIDKNIDKIFRKHYNHDISLTDEQISSLHAEMLESFNNRKVHLPTIDNILNTYKDASFGRVTKGYNQNDEKHSGFFITWQAIRGLIYFAYSTSDTDKYLQLASRMCASLKSDKSQDDRLMADFMFSLKNMWL